jgi:hypothetical protein
MVEASASEEAAGRDGEYRLLIWPSFVRRRVIITALALVVLACAAVQGSAAAVGRKQIHNLWEEGETVEVYIYTSEQNEPFYGRGALFNETRPVYRNTTTFGESLSLKSVQPVRSPSLRFRSMDPIARCSTRTVGDIDQFRASVTGFVHASLFTPSDSSHRTLTRAP